MERGELLCYCIDPRGENEGEGDVSVCPRGLLYKMIHVEIGGMY